MNLSNLLRKVLRFRSGKLLLIDTAYHTTQKIPKDDGTKWTLINWLNELSVKVDAMFFGFEILYSSLPCIVIFVA